MKKFLLTAGLTVLLVGAFAATKGSIFSPASAVPSDYTDVTPTYFNFNTIKPENLNEMLRYDVKAPAGANLGNKNFITTNTDKGEKYFTSDGIKKGNVVFGGFVFNDGVEETFKEAFSLYDFGGKIGKVLILNGKNSNLSKEIKTQFELNSEPEISKYDGSFGANCNIFWILDYITMGEFYKNNFDEDNKVVLRVRMEVNAYNNDMNQEGKVIMASNQVVGEGGQSYGPTDAIKLSDFAMRVGDSSDSDSNYDETLTSTWNPYRWMVYEYEVPYNGSAWYLKTNLTNSGSDINNGALLIRNLEFSLVTADKATMTSGVGKNTWNDYTPDEEEEENPGTDPTPGPTTPTYPTVNPGKDITPANYKFQEGGILPIHPQGYIGTGNANVPAGAWNSVKDYWDDGLMVVSSAGLNQNQHDGFVNSWNYIDFGGQVGRVACYINNTSKVKADLANLNKTKGEAYWDDLNQNTEAFGGGALNFYLDPEKTPTEGYIHAKLVFNVNDLDESAKDNQNNVVGNVIIQNFGVIDDKNLGKIKYNNSEITINPLAGTKVNVLKNEFTTNGEWDPTKWMTYEFDFKLDSNTTNYIGNLPVRIKLSFQGNQSNNSTAIFFKEISFTNVTDGEPTMMGKAYQKVETLNIGTPEISYIPVEYKSGTAKVDENVLTVTFDDKIKPNEDKNITITPAVSGKEPKIEVLGEVLKITLTDYPYNTYKITIPESFVTIGTKAQNRELTATIVIEEPKVTTKADVFPTTPEIPSTFTDITPSYYKFYKGETNLDEMLRDDIKSLVPAKLGNKSSITSNTNGGENWFTDKSLSNGNLIYRAGGYHTDATPCPLLKGFSLFDFGGKLGQVLVLNGRNSNLNEAIQQKFKLNNSYNIPKMESNFQLIRLFWILDNVTMENKKIVKDSKVHIRMELNCYNNDMTTDAYVSDEISFTNELDVSQATVKPEADIKEFTYRIGDNTTTDGIEYNGKSTGEWNPYRWMVLDFEVPYSGYASYIHQVINQNVDHNNGAWLIRSIEVYGAPNNSSYETGKLYKSWKEYKIEDLDVTGPTFEQAKENPSEKPIDEEAEIAGEEIKDENFNGFQNDNKLENVWTNKDTSVKKAYYYNGTTGKNSTLAEDAVKVEGNSVTIAAPAEMGKELNHGVVRIQTGIKIEKGATYNFSTQASISAVKVRAGEVAPEILVKLGSDQGGDLPGLARKTTDGITHYLSNVELNPGNLVLEVYFGGEDNAGRDITLSNITLAQLTEGTQEPENPGEEDSEGDFEVGEYSGEQTVNRAVQFTEEGFVNCGAMPELNKLSSYSIQFWMKPDSWDEGASLMHRGDSFNVELGANNSVIFKNGNNAVTVKGFEPGEWNQVTLFVNKGVATVLVNDKNAGQGTLGTLEETNRPFIMGGGYNGLLDEVRLWNDDLRNNNLMTTFDYFTHNTLNKWNPMWDNLVAYYKMDQEVAPQIIEYKVLETKKADGTNNHGAVTKTGVKRVEAENDKMPYLLNAAYTENERFYDRLIPRDAYLLSNEIIVLGADCDATDGSVKTRLPNNHGSIYGGVTYAATVGSRTGVAQFDGKAGSYIQASAESTHKYKPDSNSDYKNTDLSNYTLVVKFYVDKWQPGAYFIRKGTAEKGLAISMGGTDANKSIVIETNGGKYEFAVTNYKENQWNNLGIACGLNTRGSDHEYILMFNGIQQSYRSANNTIKDYSLINVSSEPVKIGEGFQGYMDDVYFNNEKLGIGMLQGYANKLVVPSVEQGRNVSEMNAVGFGYLFDKEDKLGYNSYSQDYIADYIRSLYKGYSPAKVVLSVRGHNESGATDNFSQIWGSEAKIKKFAQDLYNAAENYDGVEFDLEWCQNATQWSNLSKLSDAVEALLPEDGSKSFRISIHNAYHSFPTAKIGHEKITGFTVQQYGPNATFYPYETFETANKDLLNYGYPKDKTVLSFSTTMQGGGDIRGGAFANYDITKDDGNKTLYNGNNYMSPLQIFKRARYARENNYQGIFYWAMGNDYWLGTKDMGSNGGKVDYQGMPEYNGAKYGSFGLNANIDRVVLSANFNHPETENADFEEVEIPELDDDFVDGGADDENTGDNNGDNTGGDNNGGNNGEEDNNGPTSSVNSLDGVEYVDVYSVTGLLLKKNVDSQELQNILENGVYIINGRKVVVK
ncbi:MAG: hypothetical protein J1E16_04555 [Muribaculaceae bacterium]|nr:hypothetical protein [Muribaculaceae bacterium]